MKTPFLILVLCVLSANIQAQQDFQERAKLALKAGDSQKLSRFCSEKIEFGNEGDAKTMSLRTAGEHLARFFSSNPPEDASIQFQGKGRDGRKFMICQYKSRNGNGFRFSFYWKEQAAPAFESIDISKD